MSFPSCVYDDMRLALIDLGTNSIRFDLYEVNCASREECTNKKEDFTYQRLHRHKVMVRLGQGVFVNGGLEQDAIYRVINAMEDFQRICEAHAVERVVAVGTSALRTASNGEEFLKEIARKFPFSVDIISGEEEAALILKGIANDASAKQGVIGFVDIGGGSTEIGIAKNKKTIFLKSFQLGASRLRQQFFDRQRNEKTVLAAREYAAKVFADSGLKKKPKTYDAVLGSSGTIKSVNRVLKREGRGERIRRRHLENFISRLSKMKPEEVASIPGMNPNRVDIILPGAIILAEAMEFLQTPTLRFTKFALRDGLLAAELDKMRLH